jgi:hypothetical protein
VTIKRICYHEFYQAPILGVKIQQLLTDPRFNFRDELGEFVLQPEYYFNKILKLLVANCECNASARFEVSHKQAGSEILSEVARF